MVRPRAMIVLNSADGCALEKQHLAEVFIVLAGVCLAAEWKKSVDSAARITLRPCEFVK